MDPQNESEPTAEPATGVAPEAAAAAAGKVGPAADETGYTERLATFAGRVVRTTSAHLERLTDSVTAEARFAADRATVTLTAARRAFDAAR